MFSNETYSSMLNILIKQMVMYQNGKQITNNHPMFKGLKSLELIIISAFYNLCVFIRRKINRHTSTS